MQANLRAARPVVALLVAVLGIALQLVAPLRAQDVKPTEHPFLWRIEGKVPSYLFGTIHIPDRRVTTLHPAVEEALERCDALYTELEMDGGLAGAAMKQMRLPGRQKISDLLPPELYQRLEQFLAARKLPIASLSRMKLWVIATQIPMLEHLAMLSAGKPLDQQLYERMDDDGKQVGALETVEEQVGVFDQLTAEEQVQMLRDALDEAEKADAKDEDPFEKLIELYLAGDAHALMELMDETESSDAALQAKLQEALLWERNRRMAERIDAHLKASPEKSMMFAVGAAHMPDPRGVVALLQARGYRITRLPETAADVEKRIHELEAELAELRARLAALRRAG